MKKQIRLAMLALSLFGLAGCGLKGPLYFPPDNQPKADQVQTAPQDQSPQNNAQPTGEPSSAPAIGQ